MFDKVSYKLLKKLYRCEKMSAHDADKFTKSEETEQYNKHVAFLSENKLIAELHEGRKIDSEGGFVDGITYYKISLKGRAYIEQKRRDLLSFWVPYTITTIIAIAGLLVAIAGFQQNAQPSENQGSQGAFHTQQQTFDCDTSDK